MTDDDEILRNIMVKNDADDKKVLKDLVKKVAANLFVNPNKFVQEICDTGEKTQYFGLGVIIILKYDPGTPMCSDADQIWMGDYSKVKKGASNDELAFLEATGWCEDEDSWGHLL